MLKPVVLTAALLAGAAQAAPASPCRLHGVEHEALCGVLRRPLDPARPDGVQIDLHYAVLPAVARNKKPDPVFFLAGGPGQSAIQLAAQVSAALARFSNRRDVVLIDQRGTGRSAPLQCERDDPGEPLAELLDPARQRRRLHECRDALTRLPHGDLRFYTTPIAVADIEAVRVALGAEQLNLVGGSYGTRVALEVLRQQPQTVRRIVIDGVAPADMVLPAAVSPDNQAALDALFTDCERDRDCATRFPQLRVQWRRLLASLPRSVTLAHPLTGKPETLTLTRDLLVNAMRGPLYAPMLASALPQAIADAAAGRFDTFAALGSALVGRPSTTLSTGMHFSVVCSEDFSRLALTKDRPGADFGSTFAELYSQVCADWPRASVPAAFYELPLARGATLVLSGGIDPVTPPRHGERVAKALGAKARHVVVPNAGHGVMSIACMRDVVFRFVDADTDDEALKVDAACAARIPRPPVFVPPRSAR